MRFLMSKLGLGVILVLFIAVVGGGWYARDRGVWPLGPSKDQWTGVFLTNGQAYFGHFYSAPGEYATLDEVYYVLQTQLQSQDPNVPSSTQLSLQRLGGEIHGPTQRMRIAKTQILFTEDLRADSPLVQAIAQARAQGTQSPAPAPQAPAPTSTPAAATPTPTGTATPAGARPTGTPAPQQQAPAPQTPAPAR